MANSGYDEDISKNPFFQQFRDNYSDLFDECVDNGWIICIPRFSSIVPNSGFTRDDYKSHVLIPKSPDYETLSGLNVQASNGTLTVCEQRNTVPVLFSETFYTADHVKYSVLCVEHRLDCLGSSPPLVVLSSLCDCVDALWQLPLGQKIIELLDEQVQAFLQANPNLELEQLSTLKLLAMHLYTESVQIVQIEKLTLAVETYVLHRIYHKLGVAISSCVSQEDALLNKFIRNISDIELKDLDIRSDLHKVVPTVRKELLSIEQHNTPLGKISCIKRAIAAVKGDIDAVTLDDVLPIFVYVIVSSNVANWTAHLLYAKEFHFSATQWSDESAFCLTTLEAAIEHIKSGLITRKKTNVPAIFDAARKGDVNEVKVALQHKMPSQDLCHPLCSCSKCELAIATCGPKADECGRSLLHIASLYGHAELVDFLLQSGMNANTVDDSGSSPLHCAALRGHQKIIILLLDASGDVSVSDEEGNVPLHFAANNGHQDCVKALVYARGSNVNVQNFKGNTALHLAAQWGYESIVKELLVHGADPELKNNRRATAYTYAHSYRIVRCLDNRQKKVEVEEEGYVTVDSPPRSTSPKLGLSERKQIERLFHSITAGDIRLALFYLGYEDFTDLEQKPSCHPLCTCDKCARKPRDDALGVNVAAGDGTTALHVAVSHRQHELTRILLQLGAATTAQLKSNGATPLHLACERNLPDFVQLLLKNGGVAAVHIQDKWGNTPLHYSCAHSFRHISNLLVDSGARFDVRNHAGRTPSNVKKIFF